MLMLHLCDSALAVTLSALDFWSIVLTNSVSVAEVLDISDPEKYSDSLTSFSGIGDSFVLFLCNKMANEDCVSSIASCHSSVVSDSTLSSESDKSKISLGMLVAEADRDRDLVSNNVNLSLKSFC